MGQLWYVGAMKHIVEDRGYCNYWQNLDHNGMSENWHLQIAFIKENFCYIKSRNSWLSNITNNKQDYKRLCCCCTNNKQDYKSEMHKWSLNLSWSVCHVVGSLRGQYCTDCSCVLLEGEVLDPYAWAPWEELGFRPEKGGRGRQAGG